MQWTLENRNLMIVMLVMVLDPVVVALDTVTLTFVTRFLVIAFVVVVREILAMYSLRKFYGAL